MKKNHYILSFEKPHRHLVDVQVNLFDLNGESVELTLPAWSHGSYVIRDYSQHVIDFVAESATGESLSFSKTSTCTWKVDLQGSKEAVVRYSVYCYDEGTFAPRNSRIDDRLAFLHTPSFIMAQMELRDQPLVVTVRPPEGWKVYSGLSEVDEEYAENEVDFEVANLDKLFDSPIFAGELFSYPFQVEGIPHYIVLNEALDQIAVNEEHFLKSLAAIVASNKSNFDHFPYEQYYYFLMIAEKGGGGLEHYNSSVNVFPRDRVLFPDKDVPYDEKDTVSLLLLLAHENFHAWNVKEFGPCALHNPDYTRQADTREIWTVEGFANYFEKRALVKSGLINYETYLKEIARCINQYEGIPGRHRDSMTECGANAWIKLYKAHENNLNTTISYYLSGSLACIIIDLEMRLRSEGRVALHNLLDHLSHHCRYDSSDEHGQAGYPLGYFQKMCGELTGSSFDDLFDRYINGREDLPFDETFAKIGLKVEREETEDASLGIRYKKEDVDLVVNGIVEGSLAWHGHIAPGDKIVAIDKRVVTPKSFEPIVKTMIESQRETLTVHLFRNGRLKEYDLPLDQVDKINKVERITLDEGADSLACEIRNQWLRIDPADFGE